MILYESITRNPFDLVDNLQEEDSRLYEAHTDGKMQIWGEWMKRNNIYFFNYCLFVYYCGMRPESICGLRIADLLFNERKIIIDPSFHKNSKRGYKQILTPHMKYLQDLELHKYPKQYFLFGKDFQPSEKKAHPIRATEYWKEHVIDGLGINKKMYALKHTFAQKYLQQNRGSENLDWLRWQFNHSSLAETDTYAKSLQMNLIDESKAIIDAL